MRIAIYTHDRSEHLVHLTQRTNDGSAQKFTVVLRNIFRGFPKMLFVP